MARLNLHERHLIYLLGTALRDETPQPHLLSEMADEDWRAVVAIAQKQGILALVADRILSLPREHRPSRMLSLELGMVIDLIEQTNLRLQSELGRVADDYASEGLSFVLLKGVTMARHYPKPSLRTPGDIDLYLWQSGDYERANDFVRGQGYHLQGDSVYERMYVRNKVVIENHRLLTYIGIKHLDNQLSAFVREIDHEHTWSSMTLDGRSYRTLPIELDAVYCFLHILHHFSYLGIGLRQISDWILLLERSQGQIDVARFRRYAEAMALIHPMRCFALMAVRHLGARPEIFPFTLDYSPRYERWADIIIEDTLYGGSFGFEHFDGHTFSGVWSRRWFMFRRTTLRSFKVGAISPEYIRIKPLVAIITRLRLLLTP